MTTPGFTADACLNNPTGHYRRRGSAPRRDARPLRLAQLGIVVPPAPVRPVPRADVDVAIYGNWCGPGHSGPDTPIDAVDEACCRHDQCYCERGYADCSCDRGLIAGLLDAIDEAGIPAAGRVVAGGIATALAADPFCLCHRICSPSFPDFWNVDCWDAGAAAVPGLPPLKLCPPPFA
jgi:hypothetical protein